MGATTRFHPISLHVIRGGAAYCGFTFGRIRQIRISEDRSSAIYVAPILTVPANMTDLTPFNVAETLNGCFADDVYVDPVWITKSGIVYAQIHTILDPRGLREAGLIPEVNGELKEVN